MDWLVDLPGTLASALYDNRIAVAVGGSIALLAFLWLARRRGWFAAARRHPRRTATLVVVLLVVGLPVGWYLASPLWIRTALEEPLPIASPLATSVPAPAPASTAAIGAPTAPMEPAPTVQPARIGEFHGTDEFHFGQGTASLIETSPGTWIVRFEDFSVRNGPDLYVYLSPDADGYSKEALELGTLKATDGAFNYEIPAGTDVSAFRSVIVWCKQFSHLFAVAPLS